jgi:exodeoxyribonuclease VII large subunit
MKQVGGRRVWSVFEIARALAQRLDDIPSVWVEAEVTGLRRGGQQMYFALVDHGGEEPHQIDASMNAIVFDRLARKPADGTQVHAYGRVEFWRQRSLLRFRVERLELTGDGLLLARIEELKKRLAAEGLTADAGKKPIPFLPRRIGLVTSGEGAARADFLRNVHERFPAASVLVVHSLVQGDAAPAEIVRAVRYLDARPDVDVIVVARGGGALEDLMAFNSEAVCRAVADAATPVVSAVGHEVDVTVCDLVADLRVSTPTKAAEAVVPDVAELAARLDRHGAALSRLLNNATERSRRRVNELGSRLVRGLRSRGDLAAALANGLDARMTAALRVAARRGAEDLGARAVTLRRAGIDYLATRRRHVDRLAGLHELLSPARTVARGYAIVHDEADDRVIANATSIRSGDRLSIELRDGRVRATAGEGTHG